MKIVALKKQSYEHLTELKVNKVFNLIKLTLIGWKLMTNWNSVVNFRN